MIERYDFTDLIRRHSVSFEVLTYTQGEYINGKYRKGAETVTQCRGAILPTSKYTSMNDSKAYGPGGTYSEKDRILYMTVPLDGALKETKVRYNGDIYSVETAQIFAEYSPTFIYVMKWVEPFTLSGGDTE